VTEFVTLLNVNYLLKGLVLHATLREQRPDSRLTVYCFDERSEQLLNALALPGLTIVPLAELEQSDAELAAVKPTRSVGEYFWTATPSLPLHFLDNNPGAQSVTYVDADLGFFSDPQPLFDEMGDAAVLITPHGFSAPYRYKEALGRFNVQFLTFRRDERAIEVLRWWRERCIEWCYAMPSEGRFGDQKYLDEWPARFGDAVHVLQHPGGGVAPWNLLGRKVEPGPRINGVPVVFFHYHGLSYRSDGRHELHPTGYHVTAEQERCLYEPYLERLGQALAAVRSVAPDFAAGIDAPDQPAVRLRKRLERIAEWIDRRAPRFAAYRHRRRLGLS
jgi:hypothetical protein